MVGWLLELDPESVHWWVTQGGDGNRYYNVLHAAIWAEGAGNNHEMIEYLLSDCKPPARIRTNNHSLSPLCLAFRVGSNKDQRDLIVEKQFETRERFRTAMESLDDKERSITIERFEQDFGDQIDLCKPIDSNLIKLLSKEMHYL